MSLLKYYGFLKVIFLIVLPGVSNQQAPQNGEEFKILCKFYRMLKTPYKVENKSPELVKAYDELMELNLSTSSPDWYNLFVGKEGPETKWVSVKEKPEFKGRVSDDPEWAKRYDEWEGAKRRILAEGGVKTSCKRSDDARQSHAAHAKIRKTLELFLNLRQTIEKEIKEIGATAGEINKKLNFTLSGQETGEIDKAAQKTFEGTTRTGACGGSSGGAATGRSLANDITCLCTQHAGSHANGVCVQSFNGGEWSTGITNIATRYETIVQKCPDHELPLQPNSTMVRRLEHEFFQQLGKKGKSYVLGGAGSTNEDCQGNNNAYNVCVTYKKNFADGIGIPWLNKLHEAEILIAENEKKRNLIKDLENRVHSLVDNARLAFEEACLDVAARQQETTQEGRATANASETKTGTKSNSQATVITDAQNSARPISVYTFICSVLSVTSL